MLGYKDRSVQVPAEHLGAIVPGANGVFRSTITIEGRAVATWTRTIRHDWVDVTLLPFTPLNDRQQAVAGQALERYGDYLGLRVRQDG